MGFFKGLGNVVGTVAGTVIGGAVEIVGEVTDCDYIKEIGQDVYKASKYSGNLVGQAADGAAKVIGGVISSNSSDIEGGARDLGDAVTKTAKGVGKGVVNLATNAVNVIEGVVSGNEEKIINSGKKLAKGLIVSSLAVGALDYLDIIGDDGIDGMEFADNDYDVDNHADDSYVETTPGEEHFVTPHYVEAYVKNDGTFVEGFWRDGDGNTDINLDIDNGGGYFRTGPIKNQG